MGKLDDIIEHLEDIRSSQYAIYVAINEGNRIANDIYQKSEQILLHIMRLDIRLAFCGRKL